jgi:hypothetical protein
MKLDMQKLEPLLGGRRGGSGILCRACQKVTRCLSRAWSRPKRARFGSSQG